MFIKHTCTQHTHTHAYELNIEIQKFDEKTLTWKFLTQIIGFKPSSTASFETTSLLMNSAGVHTHPTI